jgi:D-alanyl-D-alanine carboxypeptidase
MDFETGEFLFEHNPDTLRAPASMTKNMTAYIIYEEIAAGNIAFDTMIPVSRNAANISRRFDWGGRYINAGQRHSVETMLRLIMLPSHNGASVAMAEYISGSEWAFVQRMNDTAYRLGMTAHFNDCFGYDNLMTARSVAILVHSFIQEFPDILRITNMTSFAFGGGTAPNTNLLLRRDRGFYTPSADGFKTGTNDAGGHNLSATAYRDGRRIITVVMGGRGDAGRYGDTIRLFNHGFAEAERMEEQRPPHIILNVDGEPIELDVAPRIVYGHVMVPARAVFEALGANVEWNAYHQKITVVTENEDVIIIFIGTNTVFMNDTTFQVDFAAQIIDGRTLVPTTLISESMGRTVQWDEITGTINID